MTRLGKQKCYFFLPLSFKLGDDPSWASSHLLPRSGSLFATLHASPSTGDPSDPGSVGADLALLAACNHTILSYGTFSFWAGKKRLGSAKQGPT